MNLTALFYYLDIPTLGKDMFLVPRYLSKLLGIDGSFIYPRNNIVGIPEGNYREIKLIPIKSKTKYYSTLWSEKESAWWLIKNARKIDILHLFWLSPRNLIFSKIYKTINPKGIVYVKGDFSTIPLMSGGFKQSVRKWLYNSIDILSAETQIVYEGIKDGKGGKSLVEKVVYVPNGIDDDLIKEYDIKKNSYDQKDNLIITVGRIGTKQKNNEMLLEALAKCDLRDWHVAIIGPIETEFLQYISDYFAKHQDLREKIEFTGPIYDKRKLWNYYNRAKIFCLTSVFEGMANVLSEALTFGNYIVTTPVSGTKEYVTGEDLGQFVDIGNTDRLSEILQQIICDDSVLRTSVAKAQFKAETEFTWTALLRPVADRIKEIWTKQEKQTMK